MVIPGREDRPVLEGVKGGIIPPVRSFGYLQWKKGGGKGLRKGLKTKGVSVLTMLKAPFAALMGWEEAESQVTKER